MGARSCLADAPRALASHAFRDAARCRMPGTPRTATPLRHGWAKRPVPRRSRASLPRSSGRLHAMLRRAEPPSRHARRDRPRPGPWLLLLAVAFAVRLAVAFLVPDADAPAADSDLDRVAWNLARGAGFTLGEGETVRPTAAVAPAVPWLLSLVYRPFGHRPMPA